MITIYTDASCIIPLGISGWAAVIFHQDGRVEELSGSEKCGRINRMELLAVIKALKSHSGNHENNLADKLARKAALRKVRTIYENPNCYNR